MADKRKLIELDIDVEGIIAKSVQLKTELDKLKASQGELKKAGDTNSEAYIKLAAQISSVSSEYNLNQKQLAGLAQVNDNFLTINQKVGLALDKENKSITDSRQNNTELLKIRNELNLKDEEQLKLAAEINAKIDDNNKFVKENASVYEKQKFNIGNYKDSVIEAMEELQKNKEELNKQKDALAELRDEEKKGSDAWVFYNQQINQTNNQINIVVASMGDLNDEANATSSITKLLSGDFKGLSKDAEAVGGAGNLMKSSLKGASEGMLGLVKSSLAFIATPVGAILAALVLVFALVKNAMDRSEASTNKITKIFTIFSGITNKLLKILEPLGVFLIDSIVKGFELAGKAADKALGVISGALGFLGFDKASKSVDQFSNGIKKTINDAGKLADAEAKLEAEQRKSQLTQLEYQKNAEKLRQIRDNENLTIAERIKANEDLGGVLKAQLKDELKIAQLALMVANERIKSEGATKDNLVKQKEAMTEIADIQERVTGQESEQLVNRVALQKEAAQKQKEIADKAQADAQKKREEAQKIIDKAIAQSKTELDLFIAQEGVRAKSLEESLKLEEKIRDKKLAIAKKEFDSKKITETEYELQSLNIKNEFLKKQAESTVAYAEIELKTFNDTTKSKLDANKFLTDELVKQELDRINRVSEAEAAYQTTRLETGQINAQQYADAIRAIDDKVAEDNKTLQETKKQEDADKKAIDLENKIVADGEAFAINLELQTEQENQRYALELAAAEKTGADTTLIKSKHAKNQEKIEQTVQNNKLSLTSQTFGNIAELLGRESEAGKAAAIAQVTIDTYKSATSAYAGMVQAIPGPVGIAAGIIAAGVSVGSGLANVRKIVSTETPKKLARGVVDLEGPGTGTSDSIPAMLSKGESVIKAEATSNNKDLLRMINANAGLDFSKQFTTPSVVNMYSNTQSQSQQPIDYDLLASKIANANRSLPPQQIAITDINYGQDSYAQVVNGADF